MYIYGLTQFSSFRFLGLRFFTCVSSTRGSYLSAFQYMFRVSPK